jgi:uncharacterized membrane protein YphA (DoxX/SURF4 family)
MIGTRSMIGTRTRVTWSTAMRLALPLANNAARHSTAGRSAEHDAAPADGTTHATAFTNARVAAVLVPLRLFVGAIWLRAAAEKILDPAWWDGAGVEAFVRTQLATGAVATEWCAWLAQNVVLTHARAVAWIVMVLETAAGLAILLGTATALFLVVGIVMNVSFLLMGAVNPSAFYVAMQATLLIGDAGSVLGFERMVATDRTRMFRRVHEAVACDTRVWKLAAGGLAAIAALAAVQIDRFTPAELVRDPLAALALLAATAMVGALIQAAGHGADHRSRTPTDRTARASAPTTIRVPSSPHRQPPRSDATRLDGGQRARERQAEPTPGHRAIDTGSVRRSRRPADRGLRLSLPPCGRSDSAPTTAVATTPAAAVRTYMAVVRDPSASGDQDAIAELQRTIDGADDEATRSRLRQRLLDLQRPSVTPYEEAFVAHAKTWADVTGVSGEAFAAEGVPAAVLRRAGFTDIAASAHAPSRSASERTSGRRPPVSAAQVRAAIPARAFTAKGLRELSGASAATVRRVIRQGLEAGDLVQLGVDAEHSGPGRAPVLYEPTAQAQGARDSNSTANDSARPRRRPDLTDRHST